MAQSIVVVCVDVFPNIFREAGLSVMKLLLSIPLEHCHCAEIGCNVKMNALAVARAQWRTEKNEMKLE